MTQLTPWWDAIALREEIRSASGSIDDVQMSLYNAVYGSAGAKAPYAKASYYGDITYPSHNLADLMAKVAVRLAGPGETYLRAPALRRLDQGMGGGKSHGLIGLWHLASHPTALAATDIGRAALDLAAEIAGEALPTDLGEPKVVVLACDNMTAGKGDKFHDGPAGSLYERFLWRLFEGNNTLFKQYLPFHADKAKIAEALAYDGRPVLILVDEILDYVRQLSESKHTDLRVQDMGFLKAITDVVNDVPHVAMVIVMIDSEKDTIAFDEVGQANRAEIEDSLKRNGTPATVTSNSDFVAILRRRLFDREAPHEVVNAAAKRFVDHMTGPWQRKVFGALPRLASVDFSAEVKRCYPFHPSLIHLVEQEWAPLAGFQKVRSTIRIFAATTWAQAHRGKSDGWAPLLIGPGDVVLSNSTVREAVIGSGLITDPKTQANYRGIAAADIVGDDDRTGAARLLDTSRAEDSSALFVTANPRAAERMASALFLYSVVGTRAQGRRGATEAELKAASFVPDTSYGLADADSVLGELSDPDRGLAALERTAGTGGQAARLFLTTKQTLPMWFRSMRAAVSELDRDAELARAAERLGNTGPFKDRKWVEAPSEDEERAAGRPVHSARQVLATAGLDDARAARLVILDPRRFGFGNGVDAETRAAVQAAFGIGDDKLPVQWAASAVLAVVNNQRRKVARAAAADFLAWSRVCELDAVANDDDLKTRATSERSSARRAMEDLVKRAYQHVVYLGPDEDGSGRATHEIRFEQGTRRRSMAPSSGRRSWTRVGRSGQGRSVPEPCW